jgi:general secretion pathway protein A
MYETFYSFSAPPFQLTPDSRFFFGSHEHAKAMAFLQYGIAQGEGFVVITGEIGAGKTTLVEHLLETLDRDAFVTARIVTTQLGSFDTLRMIGKSFNVYSQGMDKADIIARLGEFFADMHARNKHPLVIIDEAQSLATDAVEELRMLSNLAVGSRAPFQGLFLGQPEFRDILISPQMQQFRQRVIASCHLGALSAEDTRKYVEYRLARVGWANDPAFSEAAFHEIHQRTGGVPRRINTLCSRLLLLGFLEESHAIDGPAVANVAAELATELGPLTSQSADLGREQEIRISSPEKDDLSSRLVRVERATDRHERAISRVLHLALQILPDEKLP